MASSVSQSSADEWQRIKATLLQTLQRVWRDLRHYYSLDSIGNFVLGLGGAALMANTACDYRFRRTYQKHTDSLPLDSNAGFWKRFGNGEVWVPTFLTMALVRPQFADQPLLSAAGDFGARVTRAYGVSAPSMLLMQWVLGSGRPRTNGKNSHWTPFEYAHGVSGHAFMGAIPFLMAAEMIDCRVVKGCLYLCSVLPGWSRINDDQHYLSQVWLGWWMGYLACRAVDKTQRELPASKITSLDMALATHYQ